MYNNKADVVKFTDINLMDPSVMNFGPYKQRRTPIVVTLNDSKITPVDIQKLMEAGMNVARFKMSTSTKGEKMRMLGQVDKAAMHCCRKYGVKNWPVATCVDLKTCVVKTGLLEEEVNSIPIHEGTSIILTNSAEFDSCTEEKIFVDNPYLALEVKVGMEVSIGEDEILLQCTEIVNNTSIKCVVSKGGNLSNMDHVSVRGAKLIRPLLSKRDFDIIRFALKYQVDMIIINYVRERETLIKIKKFIGKKVKRPLLISGICTQDGLNNIDDIALFGKPFYISGGVFQDSLKNGEYSDREVSDVTNALLDGANAFILKDCNDMENVLEAIRSLNDLCCTIEPYTNSNSGFWRITDEVKVPLNAAEACMLSCAAAANQAQAKVIVMPTVTGCTAKALLRMRPACLVMTVSSKPEVTRLLNTLQCVVPLMFSGSLQGKWHLNVESRVHFAIEYAVKRGWLAYGDSYVTLQRASEESSFCDCVRLWTVAISKKALVECPE